MTLKISGHFHIWKFVWQQLPNFWKCFPNPFRLLIIWIHSLSDPLHKNSVFSLLQQLKWSGSGSGRLWFIIFTNSPSTGGQGRDIFHNYVKIPSKKKPMTKCFQLCNNALFTTWVKILQDAFKMIVFVDNVVYFLRLLLFLYNMRCPASTACVKHWTRPKLELQHSTQPPHSLFCLCVHLLKWFC